MNWISNGAPMQQSYFTFLAAFAHKLWVKWILVCTRENNILWMPYLAGSALEHKV